MFDVPTDKAEFTFLSPVSTTPTGEKSHLETQLKRSKYHSDSPTPPSASSPTRKRSHAPPNTYISPPPRLRFPSSSDAEISFDSQDCDVFGTYQELPASEEDEDKVDEPDTGNVVQ